RLSNETADTRADFNPQFTSYIAFTSTALQPTQTGLYSSDGKLVRVIEENHVPALAEYNLVKPEFMQVKTRDGFVMEAMMIKPLDFDPNKKYPVMSYTYSGPAAPSVRNSWTGTRSLWHQFLAQKGYIIWICDNRSASAKGMQSTYTSYRNFGEGELRDLEDGVTYLKSLPFVDSQRIGLWGWSFGGFMTSFALTHSQSFKIGIAGGLVSDWHNYDSIYTERYMALPSENKDGYEKSSVYKSAANLHGKLMILHGVIDDNVHIQNSIQFVNALQFAGKDFQLMLYPQSRHGVVEARRVKHMYTLMTKFVLENL
ncbi:MAG: alpha/beta hydrolase family protein, partial [Pyrinomonadaceae bacterium]